MSLSVPHPIWTTCEGNPFEIAKSVLQAKFLSGRYRSDKLLKHFSKENTGICALCNDGVEGSIEHLLVSCSALAQCRQNQFKLVDNFSDKSRNIIIDAYKTIPDFVQLLLDCSVIPAVIDASQNKEEHVLSEIFKFS